MNILFQVWPKINDYQFKIDPKLKKVKLLLSLLFRQNIKIKPNKNSEFP